ncbi:MAG: DEAD/DEAH box helicase [Acidobacteria bacterium]|nr:DEAD/DEAH box helicase [Acidobacteriota bacterium]
MSEFKDMNLPAPIETALTAMRFSTPTPIQEQAIPVALSGRDLIGCAQTGTGKTAAFCIPLITRLLSVPQKTALILAPTRELAVQITDVIAQLTVAVPAIRSTLLIGGAAMEPQIRSLARKPRIVVATPGRLLDHLQRRTVSLAATEILVLDEADRMLDMGFAPQLDAIRRFLPHTRQTLLFSATIPDDILKLASRYLKDPVRVNVGAIAQPVQEVRQSVVQTTGAAKNDVLLDELKARRGSVLIFARTKRRTDRLAKRLAQGGHSVTHIHGDRSQSQRDRAIKGFRSGAYRILVATDIAARGLDVPHIAHVINYDMPQAPEDYVHRIGRTARAGALGESLCLVVPEDQSQWRRISHLIVQGGLHGQARKSDSGKAHS